MPNHTSRHPPETSLPSPTQQQPTTTTYHTIPDGNHQIPSETPPTRTYRLPQPPQPTACHPPTTRHPCTPPRHQPTPRNNLDCQRGGHRGLPGTPREFSSCGCVIMNTYRSLKKAPHTTSNPLTPTSPTSPLQCSATLPGVPPRHPNHHTPNNSPPQPPTTRYTTETTKCVPKHHQPAHTVSHNHSNRSPTTHQPHGILGHLPGTNPHRGITWIDIGGVAVVCKAQHVNLVPVGV